MGNDTTISTTVQNAVHLMPKFSPSEDKWILWKQQLDIHFVEIGCTEETLKRTILLKTIGSEAYSLVHGLCDPKLPAEFDYNKLCDLLNANYTTPVIIHRERDQFLTTEKRSEETVTQ